MKIHEIRKYFPIVILISLVVFSLFIIKDLFVGLISAFVLAFMMRPVYKRLNRKVPRVVAGLLSVMTIVLIVIIPAVIILGTVLAQLSQSINAPTLNFVIDSLANIPGINQMGIPISDLTQRAVSLLISFLSDALSRIPQTAVTLMIVLFGAYYFLVDWEKFTSKIKKYIPVENKEKFSIEISGAAKNIIYGTLLIALIEFLIAGIAFWAIGLKFAFLYATLIAIFAFIPGLGPLIVWIPLAIYLFVTGSLVKAGIVFAIGLFLSVYVDGILRAQISGKKSNIHPFVMLLGIIGGIAVFGIFGFIIGPIVLVVTLQLLEEIVSRE